MSVVIVHKIYVNLGRVNLINVIPLTCLWKSESFLLSSTQWTYLTRKKNPKLIHTLSVFTFEYATTLISALRHYDDVCQVNLNLQHAIRISEIAQTHFVKNLIQTHRGHSHEFIILKEGNLFSRTVIIDVVYHQN